MKLSLKKIVSLIDKDVSLSAGEKNNFLTAIKKIDKDLTNTKRELEIESSLEKVRTVAMSMSKPDDMLEVCKTIALQLQSLGVEDIRNVQTAIFYQEKGSYMNYEFYAKHDKTFVTETIYTNHKVTTSFAEQMFKGKGEVFIRHIKDEEVKDWLAYQKSTNVFIDTYLENATSLSYYWHSLGPVALGISTYNPLTDEELQLFQRFLKVFDLSYRRYLDIEKAIAQAKEAQIETSLERVRAMAMAMRSPKDLTGICEELYAELHTLGFAEIRNAMINIHNDNKSSFVNYDYSDEIGKSTNHFTYDIHPLIEKQIKQIRSAEGFSETSFTGEDLKEWKAFRKKVGEKDDPRIDQTDALYYYFYSIGNGSIGISTFSAVTEEKLNVLKRFRNVFNLSYQRYTDIALAEVQAQEAKIEASLERIRAVAMGLRKSEELVTVCEAMYKELFLLGLTNIRNAQIVINNDARQAYIGFEYSTYSRMVMKELAYDSYPMMRKVANEMKKSNSAFFQKEISGEEFINWRKWRKTFKEGDDPRVEEATSMCFYLFSIGTGLIGITTFNTITNEQAETLKRFKNVFELSYQRYTDVTNAEAQAREAQIELALERIRARTMAMQKSDELSETAYILYQQFKELGQDPEQLTIGIINEDKRIVELWLTLHGKHMSHMIPVSIDEPFVIGKVYAGFKAQKKSLVIELSGKDLKDYNDYRKSLRPDIKVNNDRTEERRVMNFAFFSKGQLSVSAPEPLSDEGKQLLERFAAVFDLTYTRFLDLQKAEAQVREAQIQLALERARTQSMIMQHSTELDDTLRVFHEQVLHLNIPSAFSFLWLPDEEKDKHIFWAAWAENNSTIFKSKAINYPLDRNEPATKQCLIDWRSNKPVVSYHVPPDGVANYFAAWSELIAGVEKLKPEYFSGGLYYVEAFMKYGCFGIMASNDLTKDEKKILNRFAVEFERAYTRFLDLQKAEAQAREATIEASLERVRSRSMAMYNSEELVDTSDVLFTELKKLGINAMRTGIATYDGINNKVGIWSRSEVNAKIENKILGSIDANVHPLFINWITAWKEHKPFSSFNMIGDEVKNYYKSLHVQLSYPARKEYNQQEIFTAFFYAEGSLNVISRESLTEEECNIMIRFAKVFGQVYRRFLDLQKAEAQARESQIELSLERVRAKTMAMHNSADVGETAAVMVEELKKLDIETIRCGIGIMHEPGDMEVWTISTDENNKTDIIIGWLDMNMHPLLHGAFKNWRNKSEYYSYELKGDDLLNYYNAINKYPNYPIKYDTAALPKQIHHNEFYFDEGTLFAFSLQQLTHDHRKIFKRFAGVFGQTYRRYLDLRKAESQARQAKIEAAMEKVRSLAMSMQKPGELVEVAQLLRTEMGLLGIEELETSSIYIHHEDTQRTECWYAIKDVNHTDKELVSDHMNLDLEETSVGKQMLEFYHSGKKQTSIPMQGNARKEWINYCAGHSKVLVGFYGDSIPDRIYHLYKFSNGYMGAASPGEISAESWDLLQRATSVFSLAYTRFSDLQQAEAQAREAQIETALERVRSRTLAMQKSDELADTAAVLFKQLILLGIEPNRLYIGIIKDDSGHIEFWVTDEDGTKVSTMFTGNAGKNASMQKMYNGWMSNKKSIMIDMQGQELTEYFHYLGEELHVPFKDGLSQKRRLQYITYFSKGFIGMASPDEQPEETVLLLERFTSVFNLTYTRFNDLKIAEAHAIQAKEDLIKLQTEKRRAEDALNELKETQKQLIQSEKMASLGELTAGIAHEIQNPLNFVNNFSEVSNELIDEMNAEIAKGDIEEAKAIADDIKQNLEKINHHGKRADAIVKGMLQHSRSSSSIKEPTNINALADEYLRLSYHGLRAKDNSFNSTIQTDFDATIKNINIVPQDFGRVLLNLYTNAFYSVNQKRQQQSNGYEPTIIVSTKKINNIIELAVKDNGNGIPQNIVDKIFQPFFTTKPTGQGTGLGLSLSYDIVKAHGGEIKVETKEGTGTEFTILLPVT